jgi:hypothetical protein
MASRVLADAEAAVWADIDRNPRLKKFLREFGTTLKNEIHNAKFLEPKRSKVLIH